MIRNKWLVKYVFILFVLKTLYLFKGFEVSYSSVIFPIMGLNAHIIFCLYLVFSKQQYRERWNPLLIRHLFGLIILQKISDIGLSVNLVIIKEWEESGTYLFYIADWLLFVIYWLSLLVMIKRTPKAVDTLGNKIMN